MKKLTLATAVLNVISQFVSKNSSFSAFDVMHTIREQVDTGKLFLYDCAPSIFCGKATTNIAQKGANGVEELVAQIYSQNDMTNYERRNIGTYTVYLYNPIAKNKFVPKIVIPAVVTKNAKANFSRLGFVVNERIVSYVNRKNKDGDAPTLKQIQSALRRQGNFTCKALHDAAIDLGFRFKRLPQLSKTVVVL